MIGGRLLNRKQRIQILQKFGQFNYSFEKLSAYFLSKMITISGLTKFVKQKIKQIILELEYQLYSNKKIKQLKFFDNSSDYLFDELIKMDKYFPIHLYNDFVFEEKSKYLKMEKSTSHKKIELYIIFLKYAQKNNLFKYVYGNNEQKLKNVGPWENPEKIYTASQLQLIFLYYDICDGNCQKIQQKFQERGMNDEKFKGQKLQQNIKNIELIGLYRCYQRSVKSKGGKLKSWEEFIKDQQEYMDMIQNWNSNLKIILVRVAIRDDVKTQQIRILCRKMGRRYDDKPLIQVSRPPQIKNHPQQKISNPQIDKLRQQLISVLNTKIWFNPINQCQ